VFGRDAMRPLLFISAVGALVPWVIALVSALMLIMALFSSLDWLFARDSDAGVTALIEYLYAAAGIGIITLVLQFREMLLKRSERRWTQR
jgi:hypothetical protein